VPGLFRLSLTLNLNRQVAVVVATLPMVLIRRWPAVRNLATTMYGVHSKLLRTSYLML
jgi:hypothetical protein